MVRSVFLSALMAVAALSTLQGEAVSASPPRFVAESQELEKPALLPDGRLMALSLQTLDGVQTLVGRSSKDDGQSWSTGEAVIPASTRSGNLRLLGRRWWTAREKLISSFCTTPVQERLEAATGASQVGAKELLNIWHASWDSQVRRRATAQTDLERARRGSPIGGSTPQRTASASHLVPRETLLARPRRGPG